ASDWRAKLPGNWRSATASSRCPNGSLRPVGRGCPGRSEFAAKLVLYFVRGATTALRSRRAPPPRGRGRPSALLRQTQPPCTSRSFHLMTTALGAAWEVASCNAGTSAPAACERALCDIVRRLQQDFDIAPT